MINMDGSKFTFASGGTISFYYATGFSLPIFIASTTPKYSYAYLSSTGQRNISKAQEELLLWHYIMGQYSIKNTQSLMITQGTDKYSILHPK